jgi:hypothetical protein
VALGRGNDAYTGQSGQFLQLEIDEFLEEGYLKLYNLGVDVGESRNLAATHEKAGTLFT